MHRYNAKLLSLSDSIEEEVTININGMIIVGFSTVCPYKISPGNDYPVELGLTFLDGEGISESSEEEYSLERINNTYKYILFGKIVSGSLDIGNGVKIDDEYFQENSYLENRFVKVIADRITVDFLPMAC